MRPDVQRAVKLLRSGALVAIPTETVYGLGADASNELAVRQIFAVKGRPSTHPLIVHVADTAAARAWTSDFNAHAQSPADAFWPGPLTLILERSALASDAITGGQTTVGVRVPKHALTLEVLRAFGGGIAAPSANRFGRVSPTTAEHVRDELGDEVPLILDGGPCSVGVESTIIDVSSAQPRLLRPGGVSLEAVERVLGMKVPLAMKAADVRAPGMLESHYAPRAGVVLVTDSKLFDTVAQRVSQGAKVAVLASASTPVPAGATRFEVPDDEGGYARVLYAALRQADAEGFDVIVAAPPENSGLGLAVADRLSRAAAPRPGH